MAAALRVAGANPGQSAYLVATAHPESGGCNVIQQGEPYQTTGWGVWQITPGNSVPSVAVNNGLLSLIPNAKAAVAKVRSQGLGAWTTITSGAYAPYFSSAKQAVATVWGMSDSEVSKLAKSAGSQKAQTTGFLSGIGGFLGGGIGDIFGNAFQDFAKALGLPSPKDMFIRLGLILLGGLLILVGILTLVGRQAMQTAITVAAPESKAGQVASGATQRAATQSSRRAASAPERSASQQERASGAYATSQARERARTETQQERRAQRAAEQTPKGRHAKS